MTYYCTCVFLNPRDVSLKCWSNPTLHNETSGAPEESVFIGCWVLEGYCSSQGPRHVEVVLWIQLHVCVTHIATDDKELITFLPRICQSEGGRCRYGFCVLTAWIGGFILCCRTLLQCTQSTAFCLFFNSFAGSKITSLYGPWTFFFFFFA